MRVLQREVQVAGVPDPAVRELALDPDLEERGLEQVADAAVSSRDASRIAAAPAAGGSASRLASASGRARSNGRSNEAHRLACVGGRLASLPARRARSAVAEPLDPVARPVCRRRRRRRRSAADCRWRLEARGMPVRKRPTTGSRLDADDRRRAGRSCRRRSGRRCRSAGCARRRSARACACRRPP